MKFLTVCAIIFLLYALNAFAWENTVTHPEISEFAAAQSFGEPMGPGL
jgi:hypothetical protein